MQIFRVGGFVRDFLLGLESKDIDYVVVGATPEEMLAKGFTQVGADFPVFLHPETGDEYALARKERKVAAGYHGFETDFDISVTLEEDLARRDLTINSMAMDEDGNIIDPFNGQQDLKDKILRHTTEAFAEDPLRVLRVARFAARYNFGVANETIDLMREIVKANELQHISNERIVLEFEKAFNEIKPMLFITILSYVGALKIIIPELDERINEISYPRFQIWCNQINKLCDVRERLAFLFSQIEKDKAFEALDRMRFPIEIKEIIEDYIQFEYFYDLSAKYTVQVFDHFKVSHDTKRFWRIFKMFNRLSANQRDGSIAMKLLDCYYQVDFQSLPNKHELKGKEISEAIKAERIKKLEQYF